MGSLNFYSQLQRAVERAPAKMDGQPAQQWLQWLESNASKLGVKKEEVEWSGVREYLALQGRQRLFRQDLGAFLQENAVRIEEVVIGEVEDGRSLDDWLESWAYSNTGDTAQAIREGADWEEIAAIARSDNRQDVVARVEAKIKASEPRYAAYTLPGGVNYRELLITLPSPSGTANRHQSLSESEAQGVYRSRHWEQPNVLAHLRIDDRVDADGKRVLFIHEIQSDAGQDKRRGKTDWKAPFIDDTKTWVALALQRAIMLAAEGDYDRVAVITGQQAAYFYDLSKQADKLSWDEFGGSKGNGFLKVYKDGSVTSRQEVTAEDLPDAVGKEVARRLLEQKPSGELGERSIEGISLKVGGDGMRVFYDQIIPQVARDVVRKLGGGSVGAIDIGQSNDGKFAISKPDGTLHIGSDGRPVLYSSKASARAAAVKINRVKGEGHRAVDAPMQGGQQLGFDITPAMREAVMGGVPLFSLASESEVLDNPSTPDAVRDVIADLVGVDAQQLQEGVGRLVVTTSGDVQAQVEAARKAAFDAWFAGSKVVNQEGEPLVVHHGTSYKFSVFNGGRGVAGYFVNNKDIAQSYAENSDGEDDTVVMSVYLSIKNPMVIDEAWAKKNLTSDYDGTRDWTLLDDIISMDGWLDKYDGVHLKGVMDFSGLNEAGERQECAYDQWVAFEPEQIKSAIGNRGTYDPRDPDITHSLAPQRAQAFHDRQSGTTYFLADRIPAGREASVFLHEVVHRHGRTALPQERFEQLVGQVKDWAGHAQGSTERSIHDKAAGRVAAAGVSGPVADEELFAYAVEEAVAMGVQPSAMAHERSAEAWLQAVVQSIQRVADKLIGNSLEQLGGQDLVDLAYALAQVERPELGAVVAQTLQEALKGAAPTPHEDCFGFGR